MTGLVAPIRTPLLTVSRLISRQWEVFFAEVVRSIADPSLQYAQADIAALGGRLTRADAGRLVWVTDFRHLLRWTGSAFEFADGDGPGGYIQGFAVDPDPTTGWVLCDGAATTYLKKDGTTGNYTTPDLIGAGAGAYLKLGDTVSGPTAAIAPAFTGAAQTFLTVAGAGAGTPAIWSPNPYTPAGTVDDTGEPRNIVLRPWFRR